MSQAISSPPGRRYAAIALFLLLAMAATVGGALLFEHVGGYIPCALCLKQRTPYYLALPVALAALVLAGTRPVLARGLLAAVALLMLFDAGLAAYHAGVEWGFWAGPADCAVSSTLDTSGDLLQTIDAVHPPSCGEAALRILGLSLAGWNALAAALFAAVALLGAALPDSRRAR